MFIGRMVSTVQQKRLNSLLIKTQGVADLHNEHGSNKNETIHGITFKDDPNKPTAQFEGHKEDDNSGFRDAHDDQDEWTDHKDEAGHSHQDWKLNGTTPDGGKKGEDFWYDDEHHNITDIEDSKTDGTSDATTVDADQGAFEADFNVDNPGDEHDEEGSLVGQHRSKHQLETHTGPDYYDSHEESNDQTVTSGSFDTFDGVNDAMEDFDDHIDMPPSYGVPFTKSDNHKREANAAWAIGNVNKFDVAVSTGGMPQPQPATQLLHTRAEVGADFIAGLYIAAICILIIGILSATIAVICAFTKRKRYEKRAQVAERAVRLSREGRRGSGDVELQEVRVQEKGDRSGDAA